MIGIGPLLDFLSIVLWTSAVEGERPVSVIIVSPPGYGKTELIKKLKGPTTTYCSDLTAREVHQTLKDNAGMQHLLLGDMMSMFGHRPSVVKLTSRLISSLTGETLETDPMTGLPINRQVGIITAIPPSDLQKPQIRNTINAGGFAQRFLIIRYAYLQKTIHAIHKYIEKDKYTLPSVTLPIKVDTVARSIKLSAKLAKTINELAQQLKRDPLGTRMHHHLRALVKASARRAGRLTASHADLKLVLRHAEFFTGDGRML